MNSKPIDIIVGIVLSILSITIYLYAEQYVGRGVNTYGPNFFPQVLSILLLVASIALIVKAVKGSEQKQLEETDKKGFIRALVALILAIGYIQIMQFLGFYLSTALFLYILMMYFGQKSQILYIASSILVSSVIYGIFHFFLKIPLPEGIFY